MKTQLLSLLLFATPLMLQVMVCDRPAAVETTAPASMDVPAKEAPATPSPHGSTEPAKTPLPAASAAAGRSITAK